jgi:NDP-sugar pyrophosphorylase family protein
MNNPPGEQEFVLREMTTALVMAGGRSERMRRSHGPTIKPLVTIAGVPLLERNLHALLRAGIDDIHVVVPARGEPALIDWVQTRGSILTRAAGVRFEIHEETDPRGNIGGCGDLHGRADPLLVVFADNLTTLDLRALLDEHDCGGSALTLAIHEEPFKMSFGEVVAEGDWVTGYREKPEKRFIVSSGISVLGAAALAILAEQGMSPVGLSDLFRLVFERGFAVRAFRHRAAWIDVNDGAAVVRAERLVFENRADFDLWAREPVRERVLHVVSGPKGVLLRREAARWYLPTFSGAEPREAWQAMGSFDDIDEATGTICRYRVLFHSHPLDGQTARWVAGEALAEMRRAEPLIDRTLALVAGAP